MNLTQICNKNWIIFDRLQCLLQRQFYIEIGFRHFNDKVFEKTELVRKLAIP